MAEYIEREAAYEKCGWYNTVNGKSVCAVRKDELAAIPAADVAPVVHGRWIPIKVPTGIESLGIKEMVVGFIRCSECYMEFDVSCEWYSHYCPNCGARMEGE